MVLIFLISRMLVNLVRRPLIACKLKHCIPGIELRSAYVHCTVFRLQRN